VFINKKAYFIAFVFAFYIDNAICFIYYYKESLDKKIEGNAYVCLLSGIKGVYRETPIAKTKRIT
jgi:hypothetical protein